MNREELPKKAVRFTDYLDGYTYKDFLRDRLERHQGRDNFENLENGIQFWVFDAAWGTYLDKVFDLRWSQMRRTVRSLDLNNKERLKYVNLQILGIRYCFTDICQLRQRPEHSKVIQNEKAFSEIYIWAFQVSNASISGSSTKGRVEIVENESKSNMELRNWTVRKNQTSHRFI